MNNEIDGERYERQTDSDGETEREMLRCLMFIPAQEKTECLVRQWKCQVNEIFDCHSSSTLCNWSRVFEEIIFRISVCWAVEAEQPSKLSLKQP